MEWHRGEKLMKVHGVVEDQKRRGTSRQWQFDDGDDDDNDDQDDNDKNDDDRDDDKGNDEDVHDIS